MGLESLFVVSEKGNGFSEKKGQGVWRLGVAEAVLVFGRFLQARKDTTRRLSIPMRVTHTPVTIHTTLDNQLRILFSKEKKE